MSLPGPFETECHHVYLADEDQALTEAILEAVAEYEDIDLMEADFRLYDTINPSSLDTVFQFNPDAAATISFAVSESHVFLRDIGTGIEIWVTDLPHG